MIRFLVFIVIFGSSLYISSHTDHPVAIGILGFSLGVFFAFIDKMGRGLADGVSDINFDL